MIMRTFFGVFVLLSAINTVEASYQSGIDLRDQIKPNLITGSKPTYPQYAAVSFLKSDTGIDFAKGQLDVKSQCGALGYMIPVEKCTGDNKPSMLCSDDKTMKGNPIDGADKYTTGCCDSRIYTVTADDVCPNNAAKLVKDKCYYKRGNAEPQNYYRCACDRGRYQYSTIPGEGCGVKGNVTDLTKFNANLACAAYDPSNPKSPYPNNYTYYFVSCCPDSYSQCDANNHEVGRGNECRVINDVKAGFSVNNIISKFEECVCAPHYDTECPADRVINSSLICKDKNNRIWTAESNCESSCSKTIETNLDSYFYKSSWHCLYRKDGAIIRDEEDNGGTCGDFDAINNQGSYDECVAQGFNKNPDDCYDAEVVLKCPNDSRRVWCLEGKYCTGYNVGSVLMRGGVEFSVCEPNKYNPSYKRDVEGSNAARVDFCPSSDKGIRCHYKYDAPSGEKDCNKCWSDGVYTPSNPECLSDETSTVKTGIGSKCCNDGYYMNGGLCLKNICDRNKYPYETRPPYDAGEVEECREGDPTTSLGYRAYFGYVSCNTDKDRGYLWIYDPSNNRRCICARNGEGGRDYTLPFSVEQYYSTNGDTSNNYINVGYNSGFYGEGLSCTDADGSYYGYTLCYVGRKMGKTEGVNKGMCMAADQVSTAVKYDYAYGGSTINTMNAFLHWEGLEEITDLKSEPRKSEDAFCVNKYTHCEAKDGTRLGDEEVCALVPEGCNYGYEEACNECYHPISIKKGADNLYHLNDYTVVINSCNNTSRYAGVDKCPTGYKKCGGNRGCCYKYCSLNNIQECHTGDILVSCPAGSSCPRSDVMQPGAKRLAHVWWNYNGKLRLFSIAEGALADKMDWDQAVALAPNYAPTGFESDPIVGKGNWKLIPNTDSSLESGVTYQGYLVTKRPYYTYYGPAAGEGVPSHSIFWIGKASTSLSAYFINILASAQQAPKSDKKNVLLILDYTY